MGGAEYKDPLAVIERSSVSSKNVEMVLTSQRYQWTYRPTQPLDQSTSTLHG